MPDFLEVAFMELEETVMPHAKLRGVDAVTATVQQRRRTRVTLFAVVALVVLAPVATFAVLRGSLTTAPPVGTSPSVTTGPTQTGPLTMRGLDAVVPLREVLLEVPDFGRPECPRAGVRFHNGSFAFPNPATGSIVDAVTGDVNGDGRADVVVTIVCVFQPGQAGGSRSQIVAYTNDGYGHYTLLGRVVGGQANSVVSWPEVLADGSVRATVKTDGDAETRWHTYRWTGSGFGEVGPPARIPSPTQTRLSLTAHQSVVGSRTTLTLTVRNDGPARSDYLALDLTSAAPIEMFGIGPMASLAKGFCGGPCHWWVNLEPVAPGQSAVGTILVDTLVPTVPPGAAITVIVSGWTRGSVQQGNMDMANLATVPVQS